MVNAKRETNDLQWFQDSVTKLRRKWKGKRRKCNLNIMFPVNVSLFAHLGKQWCGNKICFSWSKNVFQMFLLQKQWFLHMFSNVSSTRNIVFPIRHVKTMFRDYSANINNTLGHKHGKTPTGNNIFATVFASLPRPLTTEILESLRNSKNLRKFPQIVRALLSRAWN